LSRGPLHVTRPLLPPIEEFLPYLESIWAYGQVTNGGPYCRQLEAALEDYLGVDHVVTFANGTLALMAALKALDIKGEVITTPYSFVATCHALLWNGIEPVFADIDPHTLNLDPRHVEELVSPHTTAILPVHVYGQPCDVAGLQRVADHHGLKLIYDAAHAFGVGDAGGSLLRHGDLSVLSFHATKVFHTFEGGAVVCRDAAMRRRLEQLRNFGFVDEVTVVEAGINGKMNELQAAFGLLHLKYADHAMARRRDIDGCYRLALEGLAPIRCLPVNPAHRANYGYFPVFVNEAAGVDRDGICAALRAQDIMVRRYFHPLISEFPMYRHLPSAAPTRLPAAHRAAAGVLCLPIFPDMTQGDCARVVDALAAACGGPRP
jgi:dTDP-4-amino-4,6-dideoxygalactose transaminase